MNEALEKLIQSINRLESKTDILASKVDQLDFDVKCIIAVINNETNI